MVIIHKALPLFGGVDLNFNVIGGTTAPTSPKENTIWANTDIEITKWSLDNKKPISPIYGQIWIKTIDSKDFLSFNALKKVNAININISNGLYQWNGEYWNRINGSFYQNGEIGLTWNAELALSNLSAGVTNYYAYNTTHSAQSSIAWDLRGFNNISFSWNLSTLMTWANANGLWSTTSVYLRLNDGKTISIGSKRGCLYAGGATYTANGTASIDLTGYTETQLSNVTLYITLGDMVTSSAPSNADRHEASVFITNAVAS